MTNDTSAVDWLMSDPEENGPVSAGPFAQGAPVYGAKKIKGMMPLVKDQKVPARIYKNRITGELHSVHGRGRPMTVVKWYTDPKTLKEYGHHNIAWRVPKGVVGIDVDQYDKKTGAETLAALETELGKLPATWSSTSRGQNQPARIYFFRVPEDSDELKPIAGKDIETIQNHLRYAAVWPSVHPSTGELYRWYDKNGVPSVDVPVPADFAELPAAWIEKLAKTPHEAVDAAGLDVDTFIEACTYETDPTAAGNVMDVFNPDEGNRHDTMRNALCWGARLAAEGKLKASVLFEMLENAWDKATDGEGRSQNFQDLLKYAVENAPEPIDPEDPDGPKFPADASKDSVFKAKDILKNREAVRLANWYEAKQRADEKTSVADLMAQLLNGDAEDVPTVGLVKEHENGWGLFYPETVNGMYGDSSVGKSVIIAELQARALADGGTVVHWEFDNNAPKTLLRRLLNAGASAEAIVTRFHPLYDTMDRDALSQDVVRATTLVTLDALNPAVSALGLNTNDTGGIDTVLHECLKPFVRQGACGVFVDHVGHEHKERQAGSIRKSQAVQGALYEVTRLAELKPGTTGRTALVLQKDNRGALGSEGRTIAVAEMTSKAQTGDAPGGVDTVFVTPDPFNSETPEDFIMGKVEPKVQALVDLFTKHDVPRAGRPAIVLDLKGKGVDLKGDNGDIAKAVKLYKNG